MRRFVALALGALPIGCSDSAPVMGDALMGTIASLPTARSARGDETSRAGLRATEQLVAERLRSMGFDPELQPFSWGVPEPHRWHNVIIEIPGVNRPGEMLLVAAHIDAVTGSPGADDNGSGVAVLLEIARVLAHHPPARTVRLCFYNCEEQGLIGSTHDAALLAPRLASGEVDLVGAISFDGLGYYCTEPGCQRSPFPPIPGVFEPPDTGESIAVVTVAQHRGFARSLVAHMHGAEPDLEVLAVDFAPVPVPDLLRSDHAPFLLMGEPGVMVTDTANFRSPHYHTSTDAIGTIDAERFTRAARALVSAVIALANEPG